MALYTILVEHKGGTYISQCTASRPQDVPEKAPALIASPLKINPSKIEDAVRDEHFLPIDGCLNVWCMSALLDDHLLLINLVQTEEKS